MDKGNYLGILGISQIVSKRAVLEVLLCMQQFGVQNRSTCCTADGVVSHRNESDTITYTPNRNGHAVTAVPVKSWLWTVLLRKVQNRFFRLSRQSSKRRLPGLECFNDLIWSCSNIDPDIQRVSIYNRDTVTGFSGTNFGSAVIMVLPEPL